MKLILCFWDFDLAGVWCSGVIRLLWLVLRQHHSLGEGSQIRIKLKKSEAHVITASCVNSVSSIPLTVLVTLCPIPKTKTPVSPGIFFSSRKHFPQDFEPQDELSEEMMW